MIIWYFHHISFWFWDDSLKYKTILTKLIGYIKEALKYFVLLSIFQWQTFGIDICTISPMLKIDTFILSISLKILSYYEIYSSDFWVLFVILIKFTALLFDIFITFDFHFILRRIVEVQNIFNEINWIHERSIKIFGITLNISTRDLRKRDTHNITHVENWYIYIIYIFKDTVVLMKIHSSVFWVSKICNFSAYAIFFYSLCFPKEMVELLSFINIHLTEFALLEEGNFLGSQLLFLYDTAAA